MKNQAISVLLLVVVLFTLGSSTQIFPKHLYVYWHTPMESAPLLIRLCVQRMQIACDQSNWNFTVLNDTNLPDHLPNYYEKYLPVADAAKHPGWKASVADLIRLAIIEQKGGMYLDISTFLFRGLGWLERLQDFQYLLTNSEIHKGKFPDVLQSYFTHYQNIVQSRHPDHGITNIEPGYESWCFIAKPKTAYLTALRNRHAHHYTNTEWDNKVEDFEKDYYLRGVFSDYLNNQKSAYEVAQETQFQLDKNLTLFGQRTNVNNHFNLVGFRAEYGPFPFLINLIAMQKAYTHTLDEIYEQEKIPLFFFWKLTSQDRPFIETQLTRNVDTAQRFDNVSKNFESFLQSDPSEDDCKNFKFIVEGSVMGNIVSRSKIAKEQKLSPISLQQRQKWWDYCKRVHNVEQNPGLSPDGRVSQIVNQLVMPIAHFFLSQQKCKQLHQILNQIAVLCAYSNHGYYGGFSDVQETDYWRKVFEKRNPQIQNATPNPADQYVKTRPLEDYSFFQEMELRLRLYVMANKTTFAYKLKFFIFFLTFTCVLAFLFFSITLIVKVVLPACKFIRLLFTKQQDQRSAYFASIKQKTESISNYMQRLCQNMNMDSVSKFCAWFAPVAIKYLVKRTIIRMIALAYIAYNAIVAFEFYYVVYFGKIYYQESTHLLFIVIQILFRKAFQKIGNDQWALPGLTLGQLHRIYVPVYIFALGASIVNIAQRTQVRNLALSTSLCMILPVLIKEVDLQLKKLQKIWHFDKITKRIQTPQVKMTVEFILKILFNLSSSVEIIVMIFLGINVILPNLRFIVHNNEIYAIKNFFHSLEGLVQFFFVVLVVLYLVVLSKNIEKSGEDTKRSGRSSYLNSETQMKKMSRSSFGNHSLSDDFGSRTDRTEEQNTCNKVCQLFAVFLEFIFYSFKIWIFYWLAYTKWSEILIRNTFNIAYSQQLPGMEWYMTALRIMAILIIFFVSWEVQKVIEQLLIKISANGKAASDGKGSIYIDLKEDTEQNMSTVYRRSEETQKTNTMMNWFVLVSLTLLLIPRYRLFNTIYTYLMAVDTKNWDLKGSLEGEFYDLMQFTWILTACSFKLIKQIMIYWTSPSLKNDPKSQIENQSHEYSPTTECLNGQNSKEKEQNDNQ